MIHITLNGQDHEIKDNLTVAELLSSLNLDARQVAVERNREIVVRASYGVVGLAAGDSLEIVTFVGGG